MVIWFFENSQFVDAWVPFDRENQKKLEFVYRHHDELLADLCLEKDIRSVTPRFEVDKDEEDESAYEDLQYTHHCISVVLRDSHFEEAITLYPAMLLGCLPSRDILIARAERMDHVSNNKINI
ncbi:hypothetical protein PHYBLDRAFT_72404 [Phycomyces blakesleeanus NRRL 1555(-)]|uniref:WWE domain-containing protein n=1 Tax=Phycomyces blakesleeanus (strain ATCC 8743b / DSM 1359 / FGSC 10004 / NBRC 33097 / NRRL 1555) TaxID=763407 RepID=A0A162T296_PHYB8|nr:hypothetical protein PHYBLDRAFT_72404 [Phycomyces blakesleeanus NRRL 1555(-)]OAD65682.1 hypothetical protein PHYBLDRAFT_72404 [Phycomyces blakesleeanus NRRL 1555(-)]|eukprot:XP_018283722.1 hypothetical protein PHYBLDRAFT_72404 [Phycomyces blakesleeanus NRRL 1555(-)]